MHVRPGLARVTRRLGLDANPLRRPADRVEAWIRIVVLATILIAAPLTAIGIDHHAYQTGIRQAREQAAAMHPVRAVTLGSVPTTVNVYGFEASDWVNARWLGPGGTTKTGQILVPAGTNAGTRITVWTDGAGSLANPPMTHSRVIGRAVLATILALVMLVLALLTIQWLCQWLLSRYRLRCWGEDWSQVEPRWSRRGIFGSG